jgi:hypothetical protein
MAPLFALLSEDEKSAPPRCWARRCALARCSRSQGTLHPAQALPDAGLRLIRLEVAHPGAAALRAVLAPLFDDPRVVFVDGPEKAMRASFSTPHGTRVLE